MFALVGAAHEAVFAVELAQSSPSALARNSAGRVEGSSILMVGTEEIPGIEKRKSPCLVCRKGEKYLRIILLVGRERLQKPVCFQRLTLCAVDSGQLIGVAQPFPIIRIYLFNKQRLPRN